MISFWCPFLDSHLTAYHSNRSDPYYHYYIFLFRDVYLIRPVALGEMMMDGWYSRGSVDEIFEQWESVEHPFGEKLEVAVTNGIENVDEERVEVYPDH